jgi:outer membrane protein TolC
MNCQKGAVRFLVLCVVLSQVFFPGAVMAQTPSTKITPDTLREQILNSNLVILSELNQVYQSKLNINVQRAKLLPSLNLSTAISTLGGGFFLTGVSILMPFLIPSNWFHYKESKYQFEAEKYAYNLLQLNTYASAYSSYSTVLGDENIRDVLNVQYQNLSKIQHTIQLKYDFGLASKSDLDRATAGTQLAFVQLSQMSELLASEKASLRGSMALPLEQDFDLTEVHVVPSEFEDMNPQDVLPKALAVSPENAQVTDLIAAGREGKWSQVFAFLNSGALTVPGNNGSPSSFNSLIGSGSFSIGFGIIPALKMSQAAVDQLYLRQREIAVEEARAVEATLGSIAQAKQQLDSAQKAEANLNDVLQTQIHHYEMGLTDLLHVLDAQNAITQASTARVRAQMDLDGLRINLHRIMLTDQFSKIKGCQALPPGKKLKKYLKDYFMKASTQQTIERLCKGEISAAI